MSLDHADRGTTPSQVRRSTGCRLARVAPLHPRPDAANDDGSARPLGGDLLEALSRDGLSLFYQPVIDLATGRVAGFAASLRWFHPAEGQIHPERIALAAQEAAAADLLAIAVLAKAANTAARWPGYGFVAVTFPVFQVGQPYFVQTVERTLDQAGLPPSRLVVEVAGTASVAELRHAQDALARLRACGVMVAFGEFGHPRADLAMLDAGVFDILNLDSSLASDAPGGLADAQRSAARLARSMGMSVLADGLDTNGQVRMARAAGCTHGRGNRLGRSLPILALGSVVAAG